MSWTLKQGTGPSGAVVTVYEKDSSVVASIASDAGGSAKANPFTMVGTAWSYYENDAGLRTYHVFGATTVGSGAGGGAGTCYLSPLVDLVTGELAFAPDGDIVMVPQEF